MGDSRYSDSDSDYSHSHKRKKKHRKRSRSSSGNRKSRKSKRSRSRDRSREKSPEKNHDRSPDRSHGRSRHDRRRRSRDRRRTPSRDRRAQSRSSSRERRYRSRSREYYRDDHESKSSRDYGSKYTSRSPSQSPPNSKSFADMTPAELNKARLQLAIEKAQAADEAIRQRHGVSDADFVDTKQRVEAIKLIENDDFTQSTFKSNRSSTGNTKGETDSQFDFGTSLDIKKSSTRSQDEHDDELFAPALFEDVDVKKRRWYERLCQLQQELIKT